MPLYRPLLDGEELPAGPVGAIGPQGVQGVQGIQGEQGIQGTKGDAGSMGPAGLLGPQGLAGLDGEQGAPGTDGPAGPQGPVGGDGSQGPVGDTGPQGIQGEVGPQGVPGIPGNEAIRFISPIMEAGRTYLYDDERWITCGDDNYSFAQFQWTEGGGSGISPTNEWEHQGWLLREGDVLRDFTMAGRVSNNQSQRVADIEWRLEFIAPDLPEWQNGNINSDGEVSSTLLLTDNWLNAAGSGQTVITNLDAIIRQNMRSYEGIDFVVPRTGWLKIWYRPRRPPVEDPPTSFPTATTYFLHTLRIDIERRVTL